MSHAKIYLTAAALMICAGCQRGQQANKPPIHPVQDMDHQPKFKTQSANPFFSDKAAMRMPSNGTVAAGALRSDDLFYRGLNAQGKPAAQSPVPITESLLQTGKARYAIFCSPCHGLQGDGKGVIIQRGYTPPPSFREQRLRDIEDGYIFGVISNGIRNMPGHAHQIVPAARWAIVAHVRVLQSAQ